jgi:Spy/CpxP family protein refolding chaperone
MKRAALTLMVAAAVLTAAASAQNPPPARQDTLPPPGWQPGPGPGPDFERVRELRRRVEEQWGRMVQTELQLNDQQMDRLRAAMRANQDRRRDIERREMDLQRAIEGQLQPGVAANQDSLNRLLNALAQARGSRAQSDQQFMRELDFLTPVQRARLLFMMRRFEERIGEIRRRFREAGPGGPGFRQRPGTRCRPGAPGCPVGPGDRPRGPGRPGFDDLM